MTQVRKTVDNGDGTFSYDDEMEAEEAAVEVVRLDQYVIGTATRSDVVVAAASTLVLAANTGRKAGSQIVCDTTAISYFKLGTGASATDYFAAVDGKTTVPGIFNVPDGYLGAVYGYGASATGSWRVTEFT